MTPTFANNTEILRGLQLARECVLAVCMHCVTVQRVRISSGGVMVEIDRPLSIDGDIETKNGYAATPFAGCSVAWKLPEAPKTLEGE